MLTVVLCRDPAIKSFVQAVAALRKITDQNACECVSHYFSPLCFDVAFVLGSVSFDFIPVHNNLHDERLRC
jgi:hypothetical protein